MAAAVRQATRAAVELVKAQKNYLVQSLTFVLLFAFLYVSQVATPETWKQTSQLIWPAVWICLTMNAGKATGDVIKTIKGGG